jgi:hypothetical protein
MLNRTLRFLLAAGIMFSMLTLSAQSARAGGGGLDFYVATTGVDSGTCLVNPCRTVTYAMGQAGSGDRIHIAAGTYHEYLTIDKSISLIGAQENLTLIDGGAPATPTGGGGLSLITINSGVTAALQDINVQNTNHPGGNGGGINNSGTLSLLHVVVSGNKAASGGGISNSGSLTITDVFISGNTAVNGGYGGGIYNASASTLYLTNVTLSGNVATTLPGATGNQGAPGGGGGIGVGGGIADVAGNMHLSNVTFSNNTAHLGGAMLISSGSASITNSTIVNNHKDAVAGSATGGIWVNSGTVNMVNTIIYGNDTVNCTVVGTFTSLGYNIDGGATCLKPAIALASDHPNTNPLLGPLAKNGGYVPTHGLLTGSPAIDRASAAYCPTRDAASWHRPQDGDGNGSAVCDIGAFEAPSYTKFTSTAAYDGWVRESTETSNVGNAINSTGNIYLGDSALRQQYRGILSFSTGATLPDTAVITGITLRVRQQAIVGGGNPVTTFWGFMVDIKNGLFGTAALQTTDFQTAASKTYGPFTTALSGAWYSINLTPGKAYINKLATGSGLTQIRLRFNLDDNNNAIANYLSLYSGNALAASRPQLVITYYAP